MDKTAVFPGSFCPFTKGHEDIVAKALPLFDKIIIAVGHNFNKKDIFSLEDRINWISEIYKDNPKVIVKSYSGLTVNFCKENGAKYLIRGVRNSSDVISEMEMSFVNREIDNEIETILLISSPEWRNVSSSLVRELWSLNADYSRFVSFALPKSNNK